MPDEGSADIPSDKEMGPPTPTHSPTPFWKETAVAATDSELCKRRKEMR